MYIYCNISALNIDTTLLCHKELNFSRIHIEVTVTCYSKTEIFSCV